jgi:hypothetical protein
MLQLALQMIALQAVILLLIRPILLWYFKVNQALRILRSIDASLKCLPAVKERNQRLRKVS